MKLSRTEIASSRLFSTLLGRPVVVLRSPETTPITLGITFTTIDTTSSINPIFVAFESSSPSVLGVASLLPPVASTFQASVCFLSQPPADEALWYGTVLQDGSVVGRVAITEAALVEQLSRQPDAELPRYHVSGGASLRVTALGEYLLAVGRTGYGVEVRGDVLILKEKIMEKLPVSLHLGTVELGLDELLALRPGDKIRLPEGHGFAVTLEVGGVALGVGTLKDGLLKINRLNTKLSEHSHEYVEVRS